MTVEPGRRVTSVDVAREAGLSRTTVSFVLNETPHKQIPEVTRQRVLDAASRLGYSPSAAARSLRSGRTDLILCLLPDWPLSPNLHDLLELLSNGFAEHGLTFVTHPRAGAVRPVIDIWKNVTPAAVLAFGEISAADEAAMRNAGTKLISALAGRGRGTQQDGYRSEHFVGQLQVQHLAAAGHRTIGYAQTADDRLDSFAVPRLDGVRQACADLDLDLPVVIPVSLDVGSATAAVSHWRSLPPPVTAVCAYNDDVALAVLLAMNSLDLIAPGDLAIIGVDDSPHAALANLTTIATHPEVAARFMVRATVRALAGKSAARPPRANRAELIRRGSA